MSEGIRRRRGGRSGAKASPPKRTQNYTRLRHPFSAQKIFSDDEIASIHDTALRVLEELGVKVLLPEARKMYASGGARVEDDMVFIGRDIIEAALKTAPSSIRLRAANPTHEQIFEDGAMLFMAGSGCPNATDLERGRRPGSLRDFEETLKLSQCFDVIHMFGPSAEPQDVPTPLRLDLSRFCAAPSARLSHIPFESDRAFPAQC